MKRQINEQNSFSLENVSKTEPKLLGSTTTLKCLLYSPLPHSPVPPRCCGKNLESMFFQAAVAMVPWISMTCLDPARWCKESMFLREKRRTGLTGRHTAYVEKKKGVPGSGLGCDILFGNFLDIVSLCFFQIS